MEIGKTLYFVDRKDWRLWLSKNYNQEKEIWLIYYRKSSGKSRINYGDAVEEALCYGWIDGIIKGIDKEKFAQRFSPRRPKSNLSEMNKERIRRLIKNKQMTKYGMKAIEKIFDKTDSEKFVVPADILRELKKVKKVWENFQNFPEYYKKIRISYIDEVRNRGKNEFEKRLNNFVKMTSKNKKFGMMR
jgi:uncharacterized protein YdeI (YjbR/CyaY-like superfamily)